MANPIPKCLSDTPYLKGLNSNKSRQSEQKYNYVFLSLPHREKVQDMTPLSQAVK